MTPVALLLALSLAAAGKGSPRLPAAAGDLPADTVVQVAAGGRIRILNLPGSVSVRGDDESTVRVHGPGGATSGLRVSSSDGQVELRPAEGRHGGRQGSVEILVPRGTSLEVQGRDTRSVRIVGMRAPVQVSTVEASIDVSDVQADVDLSTVDGAIHLSGVRGNVHAESVDGEVAVEKAEGDLDVHSVDERVTVRESSGRLTAESVDGDLELDQIQVDRLSARTVDGDVHFSGPLRSDGRYDLASHDGDVVATLEEPVSARVHVSTFEGDFTTDFPVTLRGVVGGGHGRTMDFTIGKGEATLGLETFDGDVELRRAR